jgi:hypothetical protein
LSGDEDDLYAGLEEPRSRSEPPSTKRHRRK